MMNDRIYSYSAVMMGSPILLKLYEDHQVAAKAAFQRIKQLENLLTVNRDDSQLMAVNQAAGKHPVQVSNAVFELVAQAKNVSLLPDSAFNLAIGPVVKCWKIGFRGDKVPPADTIQHQLALTHPEDVILDDVNQTIFLQQAGMEIDLGAIAKGYIADAVRDRLREFGIQNGLINLGGNVLTLGSPQHEPQQGWNIGLQKPFGHHDEFIGVMNVIGKSVVTSGIYERYFEQNGEIYHHILDAKTGYPLNNELLSVTVISDDSIDGDIYTTLLYGLGIEKSLALLQQHPNIEAIFVTRNQEVVVSSEREFRFIAQSTNYQYFTATTFRSR